MYYKHDNSDPTCYTRAQFLQMNVLNRALLCPSVSLSVMVRRATMAKTDPGRFEEIDNEEALQKEISNWSHNDVKGNKMSANEVSYLVSTVFAISKEPTRIPTEKSTEIPTEKPTVIPTELLIVDLDYRFFHAIY